MACSLAHSFPILTADCAGGYLQMSKFTEKIASFSERHPRLYKSIVLTENVFKKAVFKCQDCGQCALSQNAFTCCMRCPKQIRNGPCGGTRPNGHCEVYPDRHCIWWLIHKRASRLKRIGKLKRFSTPVDRRLHHTSAWMNMFAGRILPLELGKKSKEVKLTKKDPPPIQ